MSNIDKIRREIKRRVKFHDDAMKACASLNNIALIHSAGLKEDEELIAFIDSLQQEQSETDLDTDIETKKESESDENERIRQALDKIFKRYLNLVVSLEEECRHSWRELVDAMQLGINAMKEGQKSAEWNKEDEKMIESICRSINEESIAEGLKCHGKSYSINELSELRIKMINFLKSINQKLKQEWSEEDEHIANILEFIVGKNRPDEIFKIGNKQGISAYKMCSWLKHLPERINLQPKQEWSKEDENALKYINELLVFGYTEKFMDAQTAHDMRKWVNEHLRPDTFQNGNSHWKPSEEQMEALKNSAYGAYQNGDGPALRELYEQLEKL